MKKLLALTLIIMLILTNACNSGKSWDDTKLENTVDAYEQFLKSNPETEYKDSINLFIRELDWVSAKSSNSISVLDSFALKHPSDKIYLDSVRFYKEDWNYTEARLKNTLEVYEEFLANFPQSSFRNEVSDKIEELKWIEVKKKNKKADYIEFMATTTNTNYIDSIDVKFELKDFIDYAVSFYGEEKIKYDVVSVTFTFNFNPNKELTGVYQGGSEGDYNVGWSGEIRGRFDENGLYDLEKRMTDFSDVEEFEAEPWSEFKLDFNKDKMIFISENRTYRLVKIRKITE